MKLETWKTEGITLWAVHHENAWAIGDWYIAGQQDFGRGAVRKIVTAPGWTGADIDTLKVYASVARSYSKELRYLNCSFSHYQTAQSLGRERAMAVLTRAAAENWNLNKLRIVCRRIKYWREPAGTDIVDDLADLIADGRTFKAVYLDPPWRWDTTEGKKGSSESYYPTMSHEELLALPIGDIATDDAFLFLWCPPAGLENAMELLQAWGFTYKTSACWDKMAGGFGTGDYWRMEHELLLLGVKAKSQTHFDDHDMSSMIHIKRSRNHSEKPPEIHGMIERAIAGPFLELFARKRVEGWTCCGNQIGDEPAPDIEPTTPTTVDCLQGTALTVLKSRPAKSVQMMVSSPPYFQLRDYGTAQWLDGDPDCHHVSDQRRYAGQTANTHPDDAFSEAGEANAERLRNARWREQGHCIHCGARFVDEQLGQEATVQEYVDNIVSVMREVRRVLKDDGVAFLNIGDTYAEGGRSAGAVGKQGTNRGTVGLRQFKSGVGAKQLLLIPHQLAIALQKDGWIIRNDIIWAKPAPMPESVTDRCTRSHEHILVLVKQRRYYWDQDAIREPPSGYSHPMRFGHVPDRRDEDHVFIADGQLGANCRDVWIIPTQPFDGEHYAVMPDEIAERTIKAASRPGDVVIDPYGGVGTTGLAAQKLGRNAILIELNPEYVQLAKARLTPRVEVDTKVLAAD